MTKVAVIGVGFWGRNHARVYSEIEDVELVAVCDIDRERSKSVAKRYGCRAYSDFKEMLLVEKPDAVSICTPTTTHFEITSEVLNHGVHSLTEKPLCSTLEEAEKLRDLAYSLGLRLMPGHIERFNPAVGRIKTLIDNGALGRIILITARRVSRWPERIGDVGVVKDSAIHDLDVMRFLIGDVESVYAKVGSLRHRFEDYAEAILHFESEVTGFIEANWLTPRRIRSLIITGSEATVSLDYISQEVLIEDSEKVLQPTVKWEEPLMRELKHFINAVLGKESLLLTADDGVEALKICEAILKSGYKGERIYLR
ncbi:Gfo/Idh/MocA family oxidoreductase [Candidatus Bathyarchaeota archaeon]|nr:Gfo/Idh/MocA family oxidoreductase [Candidatus Bathyarchaeota archaeon]MBS7617832.1 Gfo/Idh/MocA family oxidoreductase [Candidatus Bathyarchaeota archaeon]